MDEPVNPKSTAAREAPDEESLKALFAMKTLSPAGLRNAVDLAEFKQRDLSTYTGSTLACICALHSCGESLERLLALGAGFEGALRWSSKHCFMLAAACPPHADQARSAHFVRRALELGAPVDQCEDGDGSTAQYAAARTGNVEMARALLAAGADANRVNERGQRAGLFAYPMYSEAASRESEEILRILAAAGMDFDAPLETVDDTTLLTWMFRNKHEAGSWRCSIWERSSRRDTKAQRVSGRWWKSMPRSIRISR